MESRDVYKARIDAQLKELSTRIADLKSKAELAEANLKVEYLKQIDMLRARKKEAQAKLEELRNAGDEAWDILKAGVEKAMAELKDSVGSAIAKFK